MPPSPSGQLAEEAATIAEKTADLSDKAATLSEKLLDMPVTQQYIIVDGVSPIVFAVSVFVLACFVGYYVVWRVTPALHTPLMSVTNAISSIIIVGAIIAAGVTQIETTHLLGLFAVTIASINIFGGFIVTQRMLRMFRKKGSS